MSEGNHYEIPKKVLDELRKVGEFKPCVFREQGLDTVTFLEKDCSILEEGNPSRSNITILKDLHSGEIIGVRISQWSHWARDL